MFEWVWNVCNKLGLYYKDAKILFLGLDNAGKTTLLNLLKDNRLGQFNPTVHPHSEEIIIGNIRFHTFDLGGHDTARRIWKDYFSAIDGILFIIDAADPSRFAEAKQELDLLLSSEELANVPFCVLGNKIDLNQAASEDDLRLALNLNDYVTSGKDRTSRTNTRPIELFMCSVSRRIGYSEAFKWFSKFV